MDGEWLAGRFEADRTRLQAVAYRLLGSASEADDAVQEAWLRSKAVLSLDREVKDQPMRKERPLATAAL